MLTDGKDYCATRVGRGFVEDRTTTGNMELLTIISSFTITWYNGMIGNELTNCATRVGRGFVEDTATTGNIKLESSISLLIIHFHKKREYTIESE